MAKLIFKYFLNQISIQLSQANEQLQDKWIIIVSLIKLIQMDKSKNAAQSLMNEQWKSQEEYKKMIIALELQNEKYRNELYQLGETVNKILDTIKLPKTNKANPPPLDQQLDIVKKQLHNVNQLIQIYQKELNSLTGKKKHDQIEMITTSEQLLKSKQAELQQLKKEVKELSHKNKALEYRLIQYGKKNRTKSFDQQAMQLKELINQNKNLKTKLEDLQQMQQKRQVWLKNNIESVKTLQTKLQAQQSRLPKIQTRKTQRSESSLPKLQSQKKIYSKWLESSREKANAKLQKEINDLQKINKMVQEKVQHTAQEIKQIDEQIQKVKQKVQSSEAQIMAQPTQQKNIKKKDAGCQVVKRLRKTRRDWVGKFQNLRFSDSRIVRQQSRIFKVLFNSAGYFVFSYYSTKDNKKRTAGKLPFEPSSLAVSGKESSFTVQAPDFIKNIRLKINLKSQKITEMHLLSNLGVQGEFVVDILGPTEKGGQKRSEVKPTTTGKQQQLEAHYEMDVKPNEAISCVFGSYGFKQDEKKNITGIWLQGLGVELIEDFVEQLI